MQLVAFILMLIVSTVLIIWLEKKKENYYSIFAVVPVMLIVVTIIGLNADAELELPVQNCFYIETNSTWVNQCQSETVVYPLDVEILMMINVALLLVVLMFAFMSLSKAGIVDLSKKRD